MKTRQIPIYFCEDIKNTCIYFYSDKLSLFIMYHKCCLNSKVILLYLDLVNFKNKINIQNIIIVIIVDKLF